MEIKRTMQKKIQLSMNLARLNEVLSFLSNIQHKAC